MKFLVLFSERIDEFFQVQLAGLRRQVVAGIKSLALNGSTPEKLLRDVRDSLERMVRRQEVLLLDQLAPALKREGIELCDWVALDAADRSYLHEGFHRLILPVVTPRPRTLAIRSPISPTCRSMSVSRSATGRTAPPASPGSKCRPTSPGCCHCPVANGSSPRADPRRVHRRAVPGYGRRGPLDLPGHPRCRPGPRRRCRRRSAARSPGGVAPPLLPPRRAA